MELCLCRVVIGLGHALAGEQVLRAVKIESCFFISRLSLTELSFARCDARECFLILCFADVNTRSGFAGLRLCLFDFDLIIALANPRKHRSGADAISFLEVAHLSINATRLLKRD